MTLSSSYSLLRKKNAILSRSPSRSWIGLWGWSFSGRWQQCPLPPFSLAGGHVLHCPSLKWSREEERHEYGGVGKKALGCLALPLRGARTGNQGRASCLGWEAQKGIGRQLTFLIFFSSVTREGYFIAWPLYGLSREQKQRKDIASSGSGEVPLTEGVPSLVALPVTERASWKIRPSPAA